MNMKPTNQILEFTFFMPNLSWVILAFSHDVTFVMNNQTAVMLVSLPFLWEKTLHMWLLSCVAINWVTCLAAGHVSENALFTLPGQEFKQYWLHIEISINIK